MEYRKAFHSRERRDARARRRQAAVRQRDQSHPEPERGGRALGQYQPITENHQHEPDADGNEFPNNQGQSRRHHQRHAMRACVLQKGDT